MTRPSWLELSETTGIGDPRRFRHTGLSVSRVSTHVWARDDERAVITAISTVLTWLSFTVLAGAPQLEAQDPPPAHRDWEFAGLPAFNFDSDEGFGYGVALEIYAYGQGAQHEPYFLTFQPQILLSTKGRRDFTIFFDSPYVLPDGWRLTAFIGSERHTATPYYGRGNDSQYDEGSDRIDGPNPHFYRFGRTRNQITFDLQRTLVGSSLRMLVGGGSGRVTLDLIPHDEGTTLLATELATSGEPLPGGWTNFLRGGLVWDTRDREVGPRQGVWSEFLLTRASETLAGDYSFTQWTLTDRRYHSLGERIVLANRLLLQGTSGEAPFYELQQVRDSYRTNEGLGGAKTLRGIPKNRHTGRGMFLWNAELRWRATEFQTFDRDFHLVVSGFVDSGRVWAGGVKLDEVFSDLHHGFGGGIRVGMGDNFVVALDVGHSDEATAPIYIGLGYLF